jgi:S-formylglutathione hydrolase
VLGANVFWPDHNEQMNNGGLVYGQDFGVGAGFYLNATQDKWKAWRMYDYITKVTPGG